MSVDLSKFYIQFRQYFTQAGDGTGAINANGNYSASATAFYVQPPSDRIYLIGTVLIAVSDNANINQTDYGGIAGGLTNGVQGFIKTNGVEVDAFAGNRFKKNIDWYGVGSEVIISTFAGNFQTLSVKFETFADTGGYIKLDGRSGDQLGIRLNDDFSTLMQQVFVARGIYFIKPWEVN